LLGRAIWEHLLELIRAHPDGYYRITWQKGHILDQFQHFIEQGYVTQAEADWHFEADLLATQAWKLHAIPEKLIERALGRKQLAKQVQAFMLDMWSARLLFWKQQAHDDEQVALMRELQGEMDSHESDMNFFFQQDDENSAYMDVGGGPDQVVGLGPDGLQNAPGSSSSVSAAVVRQVCDSAIGTEQVEMEQVDDGHLLTQNMLTKFSGGTEHSWRLLKSEFSGYQWQLPEKAEATVLTHYNVIQTWKGRNILRGVSFPVVYWRPFLWYVMQLTWATLDDVATHRLKVSWLEMAIDCEITTGIRLEDPAWGRETTWARRAAIFSLMFRLFLRCSVMSLGMRKLFKMGRVTTMAAFGITHKVQGLANMRPAFAMGIHTERLIAINAAVWNKQEQSDVVLSGRGVFVVPTTYFGLRAKPLFQTPGQGQLKLRWEELMQKQNGSGEQRRRRLRSKTKIISLTQPANQVCNRPEV
jgi:hypothetical protein